MTDRWTELASAFREGRIISATRKQLEDYAILVCDPRAGSFFPGHQWPQLADTIRLMLLVRISEETQTKALIVAAAALVISIIAAIFTAIQALSALGFIRS